MPTIKPSSILDFNYGLSGISESKLGPADSNLPQTLPLKPSEKNVENRLLKLFEDRSFALQMMSQYEPRHVPRGYLIPFLFRDELKKAFKELVDNEEQGQQGQQQHQGQDEEAEEIEKWDPKRKKKLKKVSKILKDTEEAWTLLDMYQRSLLRG